jgi:7-carboxy-7-deazaguanine synthase
MSVVLSDQPGARGTRARRSAVPVIEIFGPTIQGEGPDAGRSAYFVRFGGCDFRCSWCDSMYAVDPAEVRANAEYLEPVDILARVRGLQDGPDLVVLSGGNPALLDLGPLIETLHEAGFQVAVETQGSRWKDWLRKVDRIVVSPKGPSSGMDSAQHRESLERFMKQAEGSAWALKAVIFDETDLEHARWLIATWPSMPLYLSAGTDVGLEEEGEVFRRLRDRLRWLSEAVATDPGLRHARVRMQQHVLTWGTRRGV